MALRVHWFYEKCKHDRARMTTTRTDDLANRLEKVPSVVAMHNAADGMDKGHSYLEMLRCICVELLSHMNNPAVLIFLILVQSTIGSEVAPKMRQTLRRLDPASGEMKWITRLPRHQMAYRCEAFPGRVVVYSTRNDAIADHNSEVPQSRVMFIDSQTGRSTAPFDTHDYTFDYDDPLLVWSGRPQAVLDPRSELRLSNDWVSHGLGALPLWSAGSNTIHFTDSRLQPVWALHLPEGAYNLTSWRDILSFVGWGASKEGGRKLYAQRAGEDSVLWEFTPFKDVVGASDRGRALFAQVGLRVFPGNQELFAVSSGHIFALEPASGKVLWTYAVNTDPIIRKEGAIFLSMELLDSGEHLFLTSDHLMVKFSKSEKKVEQVFLRDVLSFPEPFLSEGFVHCFTAHVDQRQEERRMTVPARNATNYRLGSLIDSFQRTLPEKAELLLQKGVTNGMSVSAGPDVVTEAVWDFKERHSENDIGTDVLDSWKKPVKLSFISGECSTNSVGRVQSCIVVRAHSFGPDRRDDGGSGDDLVFHKRILVAETIHQEASSGSSKQSNSVGGAAHAILRIRKE